MLLFAQVKSGFPGSKFQAPCSNLHSSMAGRQPSGATAKNQTRRNHSMFKYNGADRPGGNARCNSEGLPSRLEHQDVTTANQLQPCARLYCAVDPGSSSVGGFPGNGVVKTLTASNSMSPWSEKPQTERQKERNKQESEGRQDSKAKKRGKKIGAAAGRHGCHARFYPVPRVHLH